MLIRRLVDEHFRGFYPWCTIRALEEFVIVAVDYLRLAVEAIGAAVVGIGAASTVYRYVISLLGLRKYSNSEIRLYFGQYLVLGLEFQLGADILATAVSPTFEDVQLLAAIVVIRTVLNYFLQKELEREQTPRRGIPYCRPLRPRSRGALAAKTLQEMGYTNVANVEDGVNAWKEMGYETE